MFKRLKSVIEGGIDPIDLGRIVLAAIRRNEFWILPYPEFIPMIEKYNAQVIAALRQYENDPDYQRRKRSGRGMPGAQREVRAAVRDALDGARADLDLAARDRCAG